LSIFAEKKVAPVFHQNKERLIEAMNRELEKIPGVTWGFSQPISDNLEEAVSGVKGALAVKIYGDDLRALQKKRRSGRVMKNVAVVEDLGVFRVIGQPNLNFERARDQGRAPWNQRFRCAGCDSDRRRRQCAYPGTNRRSSATTWCCDTCRNSATRAMLSRRFDW